MNWSLESERFDPDFAIGMEALPHEPLALHHPKIALASEHHPHIAHAVTEAGHVAKHAEEESLHIIKALSKSAIIYAREHPAKTAIVATAVIMGSIVKFGALKKMV